MDAKQNATRSWLVQNVESRLTAVLEAMAGERPTVRTELAPDVAPDGNARVWRQDFQGLPGSLWMAAAESAWTGIAQQVLHGAGIDDADRDMLQSTYAETLSQALSGVGQDFSGRLGREVTCAPGDESSTPRPTLSWARLTLSFKSGEIPVLVAVEEQLLDSLFVEEAPAPTDSAQSNGSKTFDLLLDVELPVSVSFGRAQVALKDVIKLTTGSIVELNRSIAEPVEVIVNNCVIARGEVVVVEGNFGVRIQQVISRQERLRTLN